MNMFPNDIAELQAYLEIREERSKCVLPEMRKEIIWTNPQTPVQTDISIIYIHGFSATKWEIRPTIDLVASEISANLYYTRLAGHGTTGDELGEVTLNDWKDDITEAINIGKMIGRKLIIVGTSTGACLATWAISNEKYARTIHGFVGISPNFGLRRKFSSKALTLPLMKYILPYIIGKYIHFTPVNNLHRRYWTSKYPSIAAITMQEAVLLANNVNVSSIKVPSLFIYSDADRIVDSNATDKMLKKWGFQRTIIKMSSVDDPDSHVIAGNILSPSTTKYVARTITNWINFYINLYS